MNHDVKVVLEDLNYLRHTAKNLSYKVAELGDEIKFTKADKQLIDEVFTEIVDDFDALMDIILVAETNHEED